MQHSAVLVGREGLQLKVVLLSQPDKVIPINYLVAENFNPFGAETRTIAFDALDSLKRVKLEYPLLKLLCHKVPGEDVMTANVYVSVGCVINPRRGIILRQMYIDKSGKENPGFFVELTRMVYYLTMQRLFDSGEESLIRTHLLKKGELIEQTKIRKAALELHTLNETNKVTRIGYQSLCVYLKKLPQPPDKLTRLVGTLRTTRSQRRTRAEKNLSVDVKLEDALATDILFSLVEKMSDYDIFNYIFSSTSEARSWANLNPNVKQYLSQYKEFWQKRLPLTNWPVARSARPSDPFQAWFYLYAGNRQLQRAINRLPENVCVNVSLILELEEITELLKKVGLQRGVQPAAIAAATDYVQDLEFDGKSPSTLRVSFGTGCLDSTQGDWSVPFQQNVLEYSFLLPSRDDPMGSSDVIPTSTSIPVGFQRHAVLLSEQAGQNLKLIANIALIFALQLGISNGAKAISLQPNSPRALNGLQLAVEKAGKFYFEAYELNSDK